VYYYICAAIRGEIKIIIVCSRYGDRKMLRIVLVVCGLVAVCVGDERFSHCCSADDRHIVLKQWQNLFGYMEHSSKLKIEFGEILLLRYMSRSLHHA